MAGLPRLRPLAERVKRDPDRLWLRALRREFWGGLRGGATPADRPKTREECVGGHRPCPYVGCRMNLYLEALERNVKPNFPGLEPWDMPPDQSCALDIADEGRVRTLDEVAPLLNLNRERVRQVEVDALYKLRVQLERTEEDDT